MRQALFAAALLCVAAALFVLFAQPPHAAPWSPAESWTANPSAWEASGAQLRSEGAGVVAQGAPTSGTSLLLQAAGPFDASQWRYLEYDLALDRTTKALFLWRSGGQLRNVYLPDATGGDGVLDLQGVPGWDGSIDAVGVAASATDVLHPGYVAEREFGVRGLRLQSDSWRGALAALRDRWSAYRPWTGRSNNTGGFELSPQPGASFTLYVVALAFAACLLALVLFGRESARRALLPAIGIAALVLARTQVQQLALRSAVARAADARAVDPARPLSAHPLLAAEAFDVATALRDADRARVFVVSENQFLGEYTTWLLRERNAALAAPVERLPTVLDAPAFVVLAGPGSWQFDAAAGQLSIGERRWAAQPVHAGTLLQAYRLEAGEVRQ